MLKYHVAVCDDEKSDLDGIVQSVQQYDVQGCFDIETYMDGNLGCFYCSERFDFHCRRDGWCFAKQQLSGLNNRKRCRQFSGSSAEVTAVTAFPLGRALGEPTALCSQYG